MDETHLVGKAREARQHVRDHFPGLTARTELPQRSREISVLALEGDQLVIAWQRLVVAFDQLRFVIPSINVTERARTKNHEHILRLRREVRCARSVRILWRPRRAQRFLAQ